MMITKMQKFMSKKNKKGFTLIELIVVIAIIAILAAIAVPRLAGSRDAAQLRADQATARTIMSAVSIAEATYGSTATLDNINEFLDTPVVAQAAGLGADVWSVDIPIASPIVVYKASTEVDVTADP